MNNFQSKILIAICALQFLICINLSAQPFATIHVSGNNIIGVCGDTITLRGINYAVYEWGWNSSANRFPDIGQTGANCVRIPWYTSSASRLAYGAPLYDYLSNLDSAIARCIRNKMIPIIELHDSTCYPDMTQLIPLSNWYLNTGVLSIINNYKKSLIIDIMNESGDVQWAGNPNQALIDFQTTYQTIVSNLRSGGIDVPLMIDAPDCGTDLDDLMSIATSLENSDPLHNLIFDSHAYWYSYANNDSLTMRNKIVNAQTQNLPFVLGEVSNLQGNCSYTLNYGQLLQICQQLNVSWLAWSWDQDNCSASQVSSNGNFSSLTPFGNDIINNPIYGLQSHSTLTNYLQNNQNLCNVGLDELSNSVEKPFIVFSEDNLVCIRNSTNKNLLINIYDMLDRNIRTLELKNANTEKINLYNGVYLISTIFNDQLFSVKAVK